MYDGHVALGSNHDTVSVAAADLMPCCHTEVSWAQAVQHELICAQLCVLSGAWGFVCDLRQEGCKYVKDGVNASLTVASWTVCTQGAHSTGLGYEWLPRGLFGQSKVLWSPCLFSLFSSAAVRSCCDPVPDMGRMCGTTVVMPGKQRSFCCDTLLWIKPGR